jgi:glycine/D-amino acid oxidase-like deaminating enzyme
MEAPGHARAGSGGESRLIRFSHGEDVWYTRSARRARDLWQELDAGVLVECGVAWFARREDGWEAQSERVLRAEGIPCERVASADLFPGVNDEDLAFTLFEPDAGVLLAADATRALVDAAVAAGARLVHGRAQADGGGARVVVAGERLDADRVVWACGAWLPALFPGLVDLRITQQDVFFFDADERWRTPGVPGWVDYDGAAYGAGDIEGRGVKVSPDVDGPAFDPETGARVPVARHERLARDYLGHRFPTLATARLAGSQTCQYELTADTNFICAPHPDHDRRVWLMGGGSGHGFKHGPALAERMEAWLTGTEPPEPRFALGPRDAGRALRTSGGNVP